MKYACEVVIKRPRDEVIEKFDSTENLYKWQPSLESFEHVSGEPGQAGGVSRLTYSGKRSMTMRETITARQFPDSFDATYEAPGVVNPCHNVFEDLGDGTTKWIMETEFIFSGFMKFVSKLMGGSFRKETQSSLDKFKAWIEST